MTQLLLDIAPKPLPTLDNFIVGANAELIATLRRGCDRLYLWGPAGSGKSHLLSAVAAESLHVFDDVHRLPEAVQEDLFRLFNRGARILLAGDVPPSRLALREDLRTRIGQMLVFEIRALSDEEKSAALRRHALQRGMKIDDALIRYLLSHVRRDLPTLMAVLDSLDRASLEQQRPITLPLLKSLVPS
ncbi:MAG: DnaA/Hda family protein [Candidatus Nitricoxidivorans perseverans]|uniref:DnaA/Hda family protein n=1 Tax=Candidatus Nitricoxidivorans perseverans TaxID=2975601 RepID=A0AA49FMY8_9PROT|nr:MAG: DnaA/Hda family protein [Candidatus Nitricoxidivorans perseverans]